MRLIPIGERVVLKPLKAEEKTKSGIYLPKNSEEKKQGIVEEIGFFNNRINFKKGDRVLYGGYSSEEIEIEGEKYLIVELKDIVAKIE